MAFAAVVTAGRASAIPQPRMWSFWAASNADGSQSLAHDRWQQFLDANLESCVDGINRIAYGSVTSASRGLLHDYLLQLSETDPRDLSRVEQLAYWINLYNAVTVEVVLRHPAKGSILAMGKRPLSIGPWNDDLLVVAGQPLTLHDIEHRILRPIWQDHRIHYAINCASNGCPNLSGTAFTARNVEAQLKRGESDFINHPRAVAFDHAGKLRLSSIFKWYRHDFAPDERALLSYLADHHGSLAEKLRHYDGPTAFAYDWRLNGARAESRRSP